MPSQRTGSEQEEETLANSNLKKILQHDKKVVFVDTNNQRREDKHL
jgi:hypothetical protein